MEKYNPSKDERFNKPYIDIREQRDEYLYIHGGFEETDVLFSFFYPAKEIYEGRFYQYMAPNAGSEDAAIGRIGINDKIGNAFSNGAYFIDTNMGVKVPFAPIEDPKIMFQSSAAAAEYSRELANEIYGYSHRPYGYVYGGSGGAYKTIGLVENCNTWDGACPYVNGTPISIPNTFTSRAFARRVLRNKLDQIGDRVLEGSEKSPFDDLTKEEFDALTEVTKFGFPLKIWSMHDLLDDGALPVLEPGLVASDPEYYRDFWIKEGYEGANPNDPVHKDRICYSTKIVDFIVPGAKKDVDSDKLIGVDDSWQRARADFELDGTIKILLKDAPAGDDLYIVNTSLEFISGDNLGKSLNVSSFEGNIIEVLPNFGEENLEQILSQIKVGDEVKLDNSNYLALQHFHRHAIPDTNEYSVYKQYEGKDYIQRGMQMLYDFSYSAVGSTQSGDFNCKMIAISSELDESAYAWMADWYRKAVEKVQGDKIDDVYRLYYTQNALHDDSDPVIKPNLLVTYLGVLHQALKDMCDWVEKGIAPRNNTEYVIEDGQIILATDAKTRGGIQHINNLNVDGEKRIEIKSGETVKFNLEIDASFVGSKVILAEFSFDNSDQFTDQIEIKPCEKYTTELTHTFDNPGTYFVTARTLTQREGNIENIYTQVYNLDRVRVVVGQ